MNVFEDMGDSSTNFILHLSFKELTHQFLSLIVLKMWNVNVYPGDMFQKPLLYSELIICFFFFYN